MKNEVIYRMPPTCRELRVIQRVSWGVAAVSLAVLGTVPFWGWLSWLLAAWQCGPGHLEIIGCEG